MLRFLFASTSLLFATGLTAENKVGRPVANVFLAEIAPLFCNNIAKNDTKLYSYKKDNNINEREFLTDEVYWNIIFEEFKAFHARANLGVGAECVHALNTLGPKGLNLIDEKNRPDDH